MMRIVLADDHTLVRTGMRLLLESIPDVNVVGEASDGLEALQLVQEHRPDCVLMDLAMPGLNGVEAVRRSHRTVPRNPHSGNLDACGRSIRASSTRGGRARIFVERLR